MKQLLSQYSMRRVLPTPQRLRLQSRLSRQLVDQPRRGILYDRSYEKRVSELEFVADVFKGVHIKAVDLKQILPQTLATPSSGNIMEILATMRFLEGNMVTKHGASAIWLYLDIQQAPFLEILTQTCGFEVHHSKYSDRHQLFPKDEKRNREKRPQFVLTKWLAKDRSNALPHFSSHTIGVAGLVIHPDCDKMLLIQEKYAFGGVVQWKLPGGQLDRDEQICDGAVREVREETGVEAEFVSVLGFRELYKGFRHDQADIYVPCLLKVADMDKTQISLQEQEISRCEWLPLKEVRQLEFFSVANHLIRNIILPNVSDDGKWTGELDRADPNSSQYDQLIENMKYNTMDLTDFDVFGNKNNFYSIYQGPRQKRASSFDMSKLDNFKPDRYKGIIIDDMSLLPESEVEFNTALKKLIPAWKENGVRSVQISFKPPKCHLMNAAFNHGFYLHHAHAKDSYILMCKWLDDSVPDRFPSFANHAVGVGGIVVNDNNEVLLIQERRSVGEGDGKPWKFPGGFVDRDETLRDGVEREVLEETGVKGTFQGILAMREQLDYKYGAADVYVVCVLKPNSVGVNIQDTGEIFNAKWIPLSEITTNDDNSKYKLFPNAFQFVQLLKKSLEQDSGQSGNHLLAHHSQDGFDSRFQRTRQWNFYMPQISKNEK